MHTEMMIGFWLMRLACSVLLGLAAGRIGRTPWKWAAFSLLAGPVICLLAMMVAFWLFPVKKAVA